MVEQKTKTTNKKWLWLAGVIVLIIIASSFFGGKFYAKKYFDTEIQKRDSLDIESKKREDSLQKILITGNAENERLYNLLSDQEYQNRKLYERIKNQELRNRRPDTSFVRNAKRISDSANRFYKRSNDLR